MTATLKFFLVFSYRDFSQKDSENFAFVNIRDGNGLVKISKEVCEGISTRNKKKIISAARQKIQDFLEGKDYQLLSMNMDPIFAEPEPETSCARLYFKIVKKRPS
jgi:hypothetical protein